MSTTPTQGPSQTQSDGPIEVFEWGSEEQKTAVEWRPGAPLLLMGGFNSGKTSAAILHFLALADAFPGYRVAVLRKTFSDLKLTTRPSFDQWIQGKRLIKNTADEIVFENGSSFIFHHLDRPDSATILRGLEINGAMLDQAEQMQERVFTVLLGRLGRWKNAKVPQWVMASRNGEPWPWHDNAGRPIPPMACVLTANPADEGDPELHWLWQRFDPESPAYRKKWALQGYRQLVFDTERHKFAGKQNVDVLRAQDEDYQERYIHGRWVRSKGHLYRVHPDSEVDYDPELIERIRNTMILGRVLDHGDTEPTCCLFWGVDQDHNLFFWSEYYQPGVGSDGKEYGIADHRRSITALGEKVTFTSQIADPSIFFKTRNISGYAVRQKRWSVADEYMDTAIIQERTTIPWVAADNNEPLSRTRLKQYLRPDPNHKNPITGEYNAPYIYFIMACPDYVHGCSHAVSEIRSARLTKVGESDGKPVYNNERDKSIPDHALDCVRYVVNSHPLTPSPPRRIKETSVFAKPDGGVMITIPDIKDMPRPRRAAARWRSRAGGY